MLNTQEAKEAALRTSPYQLSLRSKRGTERLVHTARAAYEAGWIIGKNDITNGFNTVSRQCLLDAHDRFFPAATRIFNYLYGTDAPVFLFADDGKTETLWSQEGVARDALSELNLSASPLMGRFGTPTRSTPSLPSSC